MPTLRRANADGTGSELLKHLQRSADDTSNNLSELIKAFRTTSIQQEEQFRSVSSTLVSIRGSQDYITDGFASKQTLAILDWVEPVDFSSEQNDLIGRRHPGTGQWILEDKTFKEWVDTANNTLFCHGIPGAGKTIITSVVVNHLNSHFRSKDVGVAHIYCHFAQQADQSPRRLLASLLKQLAQTQSSIDPHLIQLYERYTATKSTPSMEDILDTLVSVICSVTSVFIIIDAIDELATSNGSQETLVTSLFNVRDKVAGKMNLFVTSRRVPEIARWFEGGPTLEVRAREHDVRNYITNNMSRLPSFVRNNPQLQEEVKVEILKSVDGMYVEQPSLVGLW